MTRDTHGLSGGMDIPPWPLTGSQTLICPTVVRKMPLKNRTSSLKILAVHSLIRGVLIQSCSARAKKFTNYVFCHPQFSGVIQHIENHCMYNFDSRLSMSIIIKIINFIESKIEFSKCCSYGTTIFNILDNTTELWMTKYIIGEFFSSGGATLYKNPSDLTVSIECNFALT